MVCDAPLLSPPPLCSIRRLASTQGGWQGSRSYAALLNTSDPSQAVNKLVTRCYCTYGGRLIAPNNGANQAFAVFDGVAPPAEGLPTHPSATRTFPLESLVKERAYHQKYLASLWQDLQTNLEKRLAQAGEFVPAHPQKVTHWEASSKPAVAGPELLTMRTNASLAAAVLAVIDAPTGMPDMNDGWLRPSEKAQCNWIRIAEGRLRAVESEIRRVGGQAQAHAWIFGRD